jgi:hypothetical protein
VCVLLITEGLANLALVGGSMTVFKAKVEKAMPRKSGAAAMGYGKALGTFHKNVMAALEGKVDFEKVRDSFYLRVCFYFRIGNATDDVFCFNSYTGQVRRRRGAGVRERFVHEVRGPRSREAGQKADHREPV